MSCNNRESEIKRAMSQNDLESLKTIIRQCVKENLDNTADGGGPAVSSFDLIHTAFLNAFNKGYIESMQLIVDETDYEVIHGPMCLIKTYSCMVF